MPLLFAQSDIAFACIFRQRGGQTFLSVQCFVCPVFCLSSVLSVQCFVCPVFCLSCVCLSCACLSCVMAFRDRQECLSSLYAMSTRKQGGSSEASPTKMLNGNQAATRICEMELHKIASKKRLGRLDAGRRIVMRRIHRGTDGACNPFGVGTWDQERRKPRGVFFVGVEPSRGGGV
jgi:hypothetical protein